MPPAGAVQLQRRGDGHPARIGRACRPAGAGHAEPARGQLGLGEGRRRQRIEQVVAVRAHAQHRAVCQRVHQAPPRLLTVAAEGDDLGDHRVVVRRNVRLRHQAMVDADAGALRHVPVRHCARLGREAGNGILRAQPRLDGVALSWMSPWASGSGSPRATRSCHSTRSSPVIGFGDRMLDLQPGVHLQEVERRRRRRAGTRPCRRRRSRRRAAAFDGRAPIASRSFASITHGDGRFLDHLLVAPLHRAVALAEVHHVAVAVAEDLHLDVARAPRPAAPAISSPSPKAPALRSAPTRTAPDETQLGARRRRMPRPPPPAAWP